MIAEDFIEQIKNEAELLRKDIAQKQLEYEKLLSMIRMLEHGYSDFAELLAHICRNHRISQKELAEKIGMSTSAITHYMNKTSFPRKKLWTYLANRISEAWPEYKARAIYDILVEEARRRV